MRYARAPLPLYLLGSLTAYSRNLGASGLGNPFAKLQVMCGWVDIELQMEWWRHCGCIYSEPGHQHDPSSMVPEALVGSLRNFCSTITLCGVVLLEDIWQDFDRVMEQWSHISSTQVPEPKPFRAGSLHTSQQPVSGQNCILALPVSQILSTLGPIATTQALE